MVTKCFLTKENITTNKNNFNTLKIFTCAYISVRMFVLEIWSI